MATIRDVARQAGVSVGTVSNVLSGAVPVRAALRERICAVMEKLDYHPNLIARSLKADKTKTLGMIISDITNPFFPQLVRGAEDSALQHGYVLITFNTDDRIERERQGLSVLRSRRVDGLLLVVAGQGTDVAHISNIIASGTPIVCLDRVPRGIALDSVTVDNVAGAQVCVRHLISQGHRRIGIITGSLSLQTARERLEGYEAALREASIETAPELIVEGDFRQTSGYRMAKGLLLQHRRPSALFISNGMMTVGAMQALEEMGLNCPSDIAIASFDDIPFAGFFRPHLTAVAQPAYQIGFEGAELLIGRLHGKITARKRVTIRLEPELKIRESSGGRIGSGVLKPALGRA